jgi:hypothetical protein
MNERNKLLLMVGVFLGAYYLPIENSRVQGALVEAFTMLKDYAREHVLLCLVPAFFIAGAISVFVRQEAVMRYLGAGANKVVAYGVASVSGTILAVCSCTVLPLFSGIYRRGAGLGPATAFLYSGPAINVLAIILTARVLGLELGIARAVGAVLFSIVIGSAMGWIFRNEESQRLADMPEMELEEPQRRPWQDITYYASMVAFLVFANWGNPQTTEGVFAAIFAMKWWLAGISLAIVLWTSFNWFDVEERTDWRDSTWFFAKQVFPLLIGGVLVAGFLTGRAGTDAGIIPDSWITGLVGGNSLQSNLIASVAGAFMYFATLTEVPILQGLIGSGMGKGPALALLLAGPALSLPSMIVIRQVMGTVKMLTYVSLVIVMSTAMGMIYGVWF